jgi:hypothetical protein
MKRKYGWYIALLVIGLLSAGLLLAACGPEMATPTPGEKVAEVESPTSAPAGETPTATAEEESTPTQEPESSDGPAEDQDDWRVLGSPDAPVTIIEYSDFQ